MGPRSGSPDAANPAAVRPREWLALPGGRIRPVVSVPGDGDVTELLTPAAWLARLQPTCGCGRPRLGSGRTCGSADCVARLREREPYLGHAAYEQHDALGGGDAIL
jgi:hypothetical protein